MSETTRTRTRTDATNQRPALAHGPAYAIEKWRQQQPDPDNPDDAFEGRFVQVGTTLGGTAVLRGNLTPECATAVRAVLEVPGKKASSRTTAPRRSASTTRSSSPAC